jgi:hypothetical protein
MIQFDYPSSNVRDLKEILASENEIRAVSIFEPTAILQTHLRIFQALNLWSRPRSRPNGGWTVTPRLLRSVGKDAYCGPAPTFYVNTDMYDFGIGLDIRESPKHLREKMTEVLLERLQLVQCDLDRAASRETLIEALELGEVRHLLGEAAIKETADGRKVDGAWARVFNDSAHRFRSGSVEKIEKSGSVNAIFRWTFRIGSRTEAAEFLSSGENQALFILALLYGLASDGSCMLFDEPELHLTFDAGSSLVAEIFRRAESTKSQAIVVTHLPHLHRRNVFDQIDPWSAGDVGYTPEINPPFEHPPIRMIHIDQDAIYYDLDAVDRSAPSAHADVMKVIGGLKREAEVSIWPNGVRRLASIGKRINRKLRGRS